ncbi:hypothetical protein UG55_11232 [Frankia sp. EI5c]|nr:hypothetical protein UG55_11232 [Frankia sp. EI5c]
MRRAWETARGRPVLVGWVLSRALLLLLALAGQVFGAQQSVLGDVDLYRDWGHSLVHDREIPGGEKWQYPPGAAVTLALPAVPREYLGVPYEVSFYLMVLAVDAAVTWALARRSRPAAGYWLLATLALGPVTVARFDLLPAAAALAALLALGGAAAGGPSGAPAGGRFGRFGGWVALGAAVKVWPGLLLVTLGRNGLGGRGGSARWAVLARGGRVLGGAVAVVALLAGVLAAAGWWRGALGFLDAQRARGLQIEAVPATPFVVARMFGVGDPPVYSYGSLQFDGALARQVAAACSLVEIVLIAAAVLWWWVVRPPAAGEAGGVEVRGLLTVLTIVITSRVLSPQYLLWLLVLVAAWIARDERASGRTGQSAWSAWSGWVRWADPALLFAVAAVLTQVVYPWRYNDVVQGRVVGGALLVARNALLVIAAWYMARSAAGGSPAVGAAQPLSAAPPGPAPPPPRRRPGRLVRAAARLRRGGTTSRRTATPT